MLSCSREEHTVTHATTKASSRILVIDDEPNGREGLCTLLKEEGFIVFDAEDGEEGLRKLIELKPNVVLCDLHLPKLDGLSLLRKSRALGVPADFIMMSGTTRSSVTDAIMNGAESCLLKPLNLETVLALVTKVLKKQVV
jgi:two-component system, NtrC family, nitrogen regulation response regulator NtrX